MAYNTEIANLALGHVGATVEIADLSTEQSREAKAIRRFWDTCLEQTVRDFPWPFLTRTFAVNLVEEEPTTDWLFSYRYPPDCYFIRKILSGVNVTTYTENIDFEIQSDTTGQLIMTNQEDAVIEYTKMVTNFEKVPSDFKMALSYRIGMYIAPSLTAGDPFKMKEYCEAGYLKEISKAQANAINEKSTGVVYDSEFERVRV